MIEKKTVLTAMSGGLDSSMTALMLKKAGYNVIGATMAVWDASYAQDDEDSAAVFKSGCFGPSEEEDIQAAKEVCEKLGIKHYVVDLKHEYNTAVLDYFRDNYLQGVTPNPCIMCNAKIKFGLIPERVRALGVEFDYYATGHYARIFKEGENSYIQQANDPLKDQSYFLCRLQQEHLRTLMFPLGGMKKQDVRKIAADEGFGYIAAKKESQDFIDSNDYTCLFKDKTPLKGDIVDKNGNVIGEHKGVIYYTIGKRRGLNVSGLSEPYYVTAIDAQKNVIHAGPKSELYHKKLTAVDVVWADGQTRKEEIRLTAKIRLHHQPAGCIVAYREGGKYDVVFDEEQMAITPGQTIAFYEKDVVLGGGIIENVG